jgi:hypothetical protein
MEATMHHILRIIEDLRTDERFFPVKPVFRSGPSR